jgi:hypothetical protein
MGKREDTERFERACSALVGGAIDGEAFLRATAPKWRGTARYLFEHYRRKLPAWVEASDVEQELQLLALQAATKWEAGRSQGTIGQFIMWGAIHRAQRKLDHWRGASLHGASNKNPSRCELAFSRAFSSKDEEGGSRDPLDRLAPVEPGQEGAVEATETFEDALAECVSVREALVLMALKRAEGSVRRAAELLYGDFGARVECGLADEAHARRVVGESVSSIAARAGGGEALLPPEDLFEDDVEELTQERAERAA